MEGGVSLSAERFRTYLRENDISVRLSDAEDWLRKARQEKPDSIGAGVSRRAYEIATEVYPSICEARKAYREGKWNGLERRIASGGAGSKGPLYHIGDN